MTVSRSRPQEGRYSLRSAQDGSQLIQFVRRARMPVRRSFKDE